MADRNSERREIKWAESSMGGTPASIEGPSRETSRGMVVSTTPEPGAKAKAMQGSPIHEELSAQQQLAIENREIELRLAKAKLTYDSYFEAQEQEQAMSTLSNVATLKRDVARVEHRVRTAKRGLLNPMSFPMQVFDLVTLVAIAFTAIVTPYEIGFVSDDSIFELPNLLITSTFALGMILEFFLPYRVPYSQGGHLIKNHKQIALHYAQTWLLIDIGATVPWDAILAGGGGGPGLKSMKMLRLSRLMKLGRIIKASRIVNRLADSMEAYFSISYSTRALSFWTLLIITFFHWSCCLWGLLAQLRTSQRTDELIALVATIPECDPGPADCLSDCEAGLVANMTWTNPIPGSNYHSIERGSVYTVEYVKAQEMWRCHAINHGFIPPDPFDDHMSVYLFLLWSFGFITPTCQAEYVLYFCISFSYVIVETCFIAVVTTAYCEADPLTKEFKRRMDHLNHFLSDVSAPADLRRRTREHLRFTKGLVARQTFTGLYELFSPKLRGDLLAHMGLSTLRAVYYFNECEAEFVRLLAERLEYAGYERSEKVTHPSPTLNIVTRGTAVRAGKPITRTQYWGEDLVVTSQALRDNRPCMALTYIEIVCLSRENLYEEMNNFPESASTIHVAAMKIAMGRASQLIARFLRTRGLNETQRAAVWRSTPDQAVSEEDQYRMEVLAFDLSLQNLGKDVAPVHKEFHGMLRAINGQTPLRGFAREQRRSQDLTIAEVARKALALESKISGSSVGSGGRLMINEEGQSVGNDGKVRDVALDAAEDPTVMAVTELRADVEREFADIKQALANLYLAMGAGGARRRRGGNAAGAQQQYGDAGAYDA